MANSRLSPLLLQTALAKAAVFHIPNTAYKLLYGDKPVIVTYPSSVKDPSAQVKVTAGSKSLDDKEDKHKNAEILTTLREPFKEQFNVLLTQLADWKLG